MGKPAKAPEWQIEFADGELSDAAIEAIANLLIAAELANDPASGEPVDSPQSMLGQQTAKGETSC